MSKNVEELDLYKEYKFAYDKAHELEFFDLCNILPTVE